MKRTKRIVGLCVCMVLLVSLMVLPASAAAVDASLRSPGWGGSFSVLHEIDSNTAQTYPKHVHAIERFLGYSGYGNILSSMGETKGEFNNTLINAINAYRDNLGLSQNGTVDADMWKAMEAELYDSENGAQGSNKVTWFQMGAGGAYIYQVVGESSYIFKYYDGNDRYNNLSVHQFYPE